MAKYIDVDALKNQRPENLNNRCENYDKAVYASGWNDCNECWCDLIGNMPAADVEPVRRWIPCNEQLPKYGETVLCLCETGGITVSCITYKGTKPGEAVWFGRHYVKAWMPLSILPKMDGGSE